MLRELWNALFLKMTLSKTLLDCSSIGSRYSTYRYDKPLEHTLAPYTQPGKEAFSSFLTPASKGEYKCMVKMGPIVC